MANISMSNLDEGPGFCGMTSYLPWLDAPKKILRFLSFNHGSNLTIVLGFTQLFRCEREDVRWGFYKRRKNQDEKLDFSSKPGEWGRGGSTEFQIMYCFFFFFCIGWREHVVARRFPGYGFSCISSLFPSLHSVLVSFSGEGFFGLCVHVLGLQFPKGFSRLHFVRAFVFPSARFQHVSFSKVPACFLPSSKVLCVCVSVGSAMSVGIFLGQHFQLISLEQGSFLLCGFVISVELLGACISRLFPSASSPTRFSVSEVELLASVVFLVEGSPFTYVFLLVCS